MFLDLFDSAEICESGAARLRRRYPRVDSGVDLVLEVRLQLVVERAFPRSRPAPSAGEGTKARPERCQAPSKTRATATAIVFQRACSTVSCLRPARVMA